MVSEARENKKSDLTVSNWFKDYLLVFLSRIIEYTFRAILFCLPLGVYMLLLQLRSKASSVSSISVYTNDKSAWQFVYPNYMLVSVNPKSLTENYKKKKAIFDGFVESNKYFIVIMFLAILMAILILKK